MLLTQELLLILIFLPGFSDNSANVNTQCSRSLALTSQTIDSTIHQCSPERSDLFLQGSG